MSIEQFHKKWIHQLAIGAFVALLPFVVLLIVSVILYGLNTAGVCVERGRVLSEPELRKAVLRNLVKFRMDDANGVNQGFAFDNRNFRIGIISPPPKKPLSKLLDEFFNNGKSFEENFRIEVIASPRDRGFSFDSLREPFVLVKYEASHKSSAQFMASKNIHKIEISGQERKEYAPNSYPVVEISEWSRRQSMLSLYQRLLGFGNHYYQMMEEISIEKDCCDNNHDRLSEEEYMANKWFAYKDSKKSLENISSLHWGIAQISNCGDILTHDVVYTNVPITTIKWLWPMDS